MVKIYSAPACVYCKTLMGYLSNHKIEFINIDVSKDKKELEKMIKDSGQMAVPVIDIDGEIMVGFDESTLRKALGL